MPHVDSSNPRREDDDDDDDDEIPDLVPFDDGPPNADANPYGDRFHTDCGRETGPLRVRMAPYRYPDPSCRLYRLGHICLVAIPPLSKEPVCDSAAIWSLNPSLRFCQHYHYVMIPRYPAPVPPPTPTETRRFSRADIAALGNVLGAWLTGTERTGPTRNAAADSANSLEDAFGENVEEVFLDM